MVSLNDLAGIYCLTSPSGSVYVGQAVNLNKRMNEYKGLHCKSQRYLFCSIKKHTFEKFKVEFLFTCNFNDFEREKLKDLLNDLETEFILVKNSFIDLNSKGMNLTTGGGVCVASKETRAKMSAWQIGKIMSDESRAKMSEANKNRSAESRAKISKAQKGNQNMLGKKHSDESRAKMSDNHANVKGDNHPLRKRNAKRYADRLFRLKSRSLTEPLNIAKISGVQSMLF